MLKIIEVSSEDHLTQLRSQENSAYDYLYICKYSGEIQLSDNGELKTLTGNATYLGGKTADEWQAEIDGIIDGTTPVAKATTADTATSLKIGTSQIYWNIEIGQVTPTNGVYSLTISFRSNSIPSPGLYAVTVLGSPQDYQRAYFTGIIYLSLTNYVQFLQACVEDDSTYSSPNNHSITINMKSSVDIYGVKVVITALSNCNM